MIELLLFVIMIFVVIIVNVDHKRDMKVPMCKEQSSNPYYNKSFEKCVSYDKYVCDQLYVSMIKKSHLMNDYEIGICLNIMNNYAVEENDADKNNADKNDANKNNVLKRAYFVTHNMMINPGYLSLLYAVNFYKKLHKYKLCEPVDRYYIDNDKECITEYMQSIGMDKVVCNDVHFPSTDDIFAVMLRDRKNELSCPNN